MSGAGLRVERAGAVATVVLDAPERRNALTDAVLAALANRLGALDADPEVRCIVLAGRPEVFAAGADIGELADTPVAEACDGDRFRSWEALRAIRTPLVAAVSGHCLGGGCELALLADVVVASATASFGLPETRLGLIPGGGGTQWLPRAIGKARAMDVVLTGRRLSAEEAERAGLVSRVVAAERLMTEAHDVAAAIAARPATAQRLAKQVIATAFEAPPHAGVRAERAAFATALASDDAREGLRAFLEKRPPAWTHR